MPELQSAIDRANEPEVRRQLQQDLERQEAQQQQQEQQQESEAQTGRNREQDENPTQTQDEAPEHEQTWAEASVAELKDFVAGGKEGARQLTRFVLGVEFGKDRDGQTLTNPDDLQAQSAQHKAALQDGVDKSLDSGHPLRVTVNLPANAQGQTRTVELTMRPGAGSGSSHITASDPSGEDLPGEVQQQLGQLGFKPQGNERSNELSTDLIPNGEIAKRLHTACRELQTGEPTAERKVEHQQDAGRGR